MSKKTISEGENIKGLTGITKAEGTVTLLVEIGNIKENFPFFIIKSKTFKEDLLLGLDLIKKFKLRQDENLRISQKSEIDKNENSTSANMKKEDILTVNKTQAGIDKILKENEQIFANSKFDIGITKDYEASIKLTQVKYIAKKPYRTSFQDKREIEKQIGELLKADLIEESCSPYAAPVILVYKKEEGKQSRLCMDYTEFNKSLVPESQPFPRIDDLTVHARDCKFFTKIDVNSAFWSIPVREKDRYKTAFVTHNGHWQWKRLPFGLKSSPAIFQRVLSSILRKYGLGDFAVNYIDDVLIYSKTYAEHLKHVQLTLKALLEAGFKLNKEKCKFAQRKIIYLGHEIGENNVRPLSDNLVAIKKFPIPETRKHIWQFLGKVNFYLQYIPKHTILLEPLHNLLRKNVEFCWSNKCQVHFEKIKEHLCSAPVLAIFDPEGQIYIFTDASIDGVGAILKQPQENKELKPVFYFSRKLTKTQKTKRATFIECLAIKEAILYWQYYLIGKKFIVFTDHKPIENFNIKKS